MSILVIVYTVFAIMHLITAVDAPVSDNKVLLVLASGVGAILGVWLAIIIFRGRRKCHSSDERSN